MAFGQWFSRGGAIVMGALARLWPGPLPTGRCMAVKQHGAGSGAGGAQEAWAFAAALRAWVRACCLRRLAWRCCSRCRCSSV